MKKDTVRLRDLAAGLLVAGGGDPTASIRTLRNVRLVVLGGEIGFEAAP